MTQPRVTGAEIKALAREMDRRFRLQVIEAPPAPPRPPRAPRWWRS